MKLKFDPHELVILNGDCSKNYTIVSCKQEDSETNKYKLSDGKWYIEDQLKSCYNTYMILFGTDDNPVLMKAINIGYALLTLAKRATCHCDYELLEKAFLGCTNDEEYVKMFAHFYPDDISTVYQISETIYDSNEYVSVITYTQEYAKAEVVEI